MLPRRVLAYVALVVAAAGVCTVAMGLLPSAPIGWFGLGVALLALLASTSTVAIPGTGVTLNVDTPFVLALVLLDHGPLAIAVSAVDMAAATIWAGLARRRPHTLPFNAAAGALGAAAAVGLVQASQGAPEPLPAFAAGLAMFVANSAVVAGAVRVSSGRLPDGEWRENLLVTGLGYLASASLAWLLVTAPLIGMLAAPVAGVVWAAYHSRQGHATERVERVREREEMYLPTLEALVAAIEARDESSVGHNRRVRNYALGLAQAVGIVDEEVLTAIKYGGLLHDVGKIAIPDTLLHAQRRLDEAELVRVRRHAAIGSDLIRHVPFPPGVVEVVRHHHERWDGRGYPDGLAGEAIPLAARFVAIAEAYDDQRTGGGWRAPSEQDAALTAIARDGDQAFDPKLIAAFLRWQRSSPSSPDEQLRWNGANDAIRESSLEQARLHDLAFRDALTGLMNGRAFHRDLDAACASGAPIGLLMLDLDGFKGVNDHFGHDFGDRMLERVGVALATIEGAERRAYRNGGDEFVVLLAGATAENLSRHVDAVRAAAQAERVPVPASGPRAHLPVRTSIGAAVARGGTPEALIKAADGAMYVDKQSRTSRKARGERPDVLDADAVTGGTAAERSAP